jgi:PTS system nitrogen regulatory IIA component
MTLEEVAEYLRVSERTVYDWAQKGELPCGKFGTAWRFKRDDIQIWVDRNLQSARKNDIQKPLMLETVLTPERVRIIKGKISKVAVLNQLVDVLAETPAVKDRAELAREIFYREKLLSTGIGLGIAVPHVRIASVKELVMAVAVVNDGVDDYDSLDNQLVQLVFMIAAGKDQHPEHIRALSAISFKVKDYQAREEFSEAETPEAFFELLIKK